MNDKLKAALNILLESGELRKNEKGHYYLTLTQRTGKIDEVEFQGKKISMSGFQLSLNGFNVKLATAAKADKPAKEAKPTYSLADLEADFS